MNNKKEKESLFDYIWDGFGNCTDEELEKCLQSGLIYIPYIPLQITHIKLTDKKKEK